MLSQSTPIIPRLTDGRHRRAPKSVGLYLRGQYAISIGRLGEDAHQNQSGNGGDRVCTAASDPYKVYRKTVYILCTNSHTFAWTFLV